MNGFSFSSWAVGPKHDDRWRSVWFDVKERGDLCGYFFIAVDTLEETLVHEGEDRVEQDHGLGDCRDRQGGVFGLNAFGDDRAGRKVASGRTARSDQFLGIDSEFRRVGSHPPDGATGILDTLVGRHAVFALNPVVGAGADQAAAGEVLGLAGEGSDRAGGPSAAEEENDDRTRVGFLPAGREIDMHLQFSLSDGLVDVLFCRQAALSFLGNGLHGEAKRREGRD